MDNQTIFYIDLLIKGIIGLASIFLVPKAYKALIAIESKIAQEVGQSNFDYLKNYLLNEYKLHPEIFNEENIVAFTEIVLAKFGAKISEDTIRRVIDLIASGITDIK